MWLIDRIAERRIREAQQQGEFDNLPGEGAPLALDDDALVPAELRAGYRLLKNAGYLPPQLQLRREIDEVGALIAMARTAEQKQALGKRLNLLLLKLNNGAAGADSLRSEAAYFERLCARCKSATSA